MVAVNTRAIGKRKDGKQLIEAVVIADETPTELPTTGEGISGMGADDCFAPFSVLYIVGDAENKVYIANESGIFIPQ
jgi:hypothetical protein